jgi:DNA-binding MarR family transcriptional regulator
MGTQVNELVRLFLSILHMFSMIEKKPWEFGTGTKVYLTEIQTVSMIGENPQMNLTQLSESMGVTRGAISQTVRKLVTKKLVLRTNARNQKEVHLELTEFGWMVSHAYQARMKEVFDFADELYASATPDERKLVERLFLQIHRNMKNRLT